MFAEGLFKWTDGGKKKKSSKTDKENSSGGMGEEGYHMNGRTLAPSVLVSKNDHEYACAGVDTQTRTHTHTLD